VVGVATSCVTAVPPGRNPAAKSATAHFSSVLFIENLLDSHDENFNPPLESIPAIQNTPSMRLTCVGRGRSSDRAYPEGNRKVKTIEEEH
jgi:hypothetical protein